MRKSPRPVEETGLVQEFLSCWKGAEDFLIKPALFRLIHLEVISRSLFEATKCTKKHETR